MATYPASPVPSRDFVVQPRFRTLISTIDTGGEQRKQKSLFPTYDVSLRYNALTNAQIQLLWTFYIARKGAYEAFYVYDLVAFDHVGEYVGTGDDSETIFDIPGISTTDQVIYVDSVEQEETVDYSILTGGGDSSSDRVEFVAAPSEGGIITADFSGYLRIRTRFTEDTFTRTSFATALFTTGIQLTGVKPA